MGGNWSTAGSTGGDSSVNQVILVTHSRNPPRVDGKMLLKEEAYTAYEHTILTAVVLRMIGLQAYSASYTR